jgi:phage terminase small subunit
MALTERQRRFVREYLVDLNATQAAIRAGFSARSAAVLGCRALRDRNVSAAVAEALREHLERTGSMPRRVVRERARSLTERQRKFAEEYALDLNATQGAIRAGYSPYAAASIGHRLCGEPAVATAIAAALRRRVERTGRMPQRVTARRPHELTDRQRRFIDEYLIDLNATRAAVRAGYAPRHADAVASRIRRKPEIAAAIAQAQEERSQRTRVSADRVVEELARLAFADEGRALNWCMRMAAAPSPAEAGKRVRRKKILPRDAGESR